MLKNYFKIAVRTFSRQKVFSFINISGLAVGLAGALLIAAYIIDELSYDLIHPNAATTYRLGTQHFEEGNENFYASAPAMWSNQLKERYPEVNSVLRTSWFGYPFSVEYSEIDKVLLTEELFFVESSYPDVLYFDVISGNRQNAFSEINTMAISQSAAKMVFGDENPIGKTLTIQHPFATSQKELLLTVTAVFRDYPANTHYKPSYLVNMQSLKPIIEWANYDDMFTGWLSGFMASYVVFEEDADLDKMTHELSALISENIPDEEAGNFAPFFRHVNDLHFDEQVQWSSEGSGDITYVYIFGSIAILLIVIACINYMNLATAKSVKRSREVGLRKVMGSTRLQIIFQFINESFITTLLSLVLALVLVFLSLPLFNTLSQKSFELISFFNIWLIIGVFIILMTVSLLAGSYPSFYLSRFNPVQVLKGGKVNMKGSDMLRKTLVIVQFAISFFLVISTGVLLKQVNFLKSSKLNEQGEQLISIRYGGIAPTEKYEAFKNELLNDPNINEVTMANHLPRQNYFGGIGVAVRAPESSEQEYQWSELNVDYNFAEVFQLEFLAGRDFDVNNPADSNSVLLNETAVKNLGKAIEEVIGLNLEEAESREISTVIGVVKDFPYRSMHQTIGPLRISARPHPVDKIVYVKLPAKDIQSHVAGVEAKWNEVYPGIGFDYWFLDQEFGRMYESEMRMADLTESFSALAIFIACLGLFGLASYMTEQKTKEIGIRKVLGARVGQIISLFLMVFLKMLFISVIIGGPIAFFLMNEWLQQFVYHVSIDWKIIGGSIVIVFGLTVLTVGYELLKASTSNPADAIRYE